MRVLVDSRPVRPPMRMLRWCSRLELRTSRDALLKPSSNGGSRRVMATALLGVSLATYANSILSWCNISAPLLSFLCPLLVDSVLAWPLIFDASTHHCALLL